MFIGNFTYSIDAKGRVSIPSKLRKYVHSEANDTFIITRGTVQCLDLYPLDIWRDQIASKLSKLNSFDPQEAVFLRMFLQEASEDKLDGQSRLIIPKSLIEYSAIEKEVFILGAMQKIELWNPTIYQEYIKNCNKSYEEIAKEVMKM